MSPSSAKRLIASRRGRRWARGIAALAFAALAWPSLGPLPWLATGRHTHEYHAHTHEGEGVAHEHRHADASAIPGSPTHPEDHDCAECKVLKHLARCIPAAPAVAVVSPASGCDAASPFATLPHPRRAAALLPPARAPPRSA